MENEKSTKSETKVSILNFLPDTLKNLSNIKQENMATKVDDIMKEKFLCQARFAEEVEKIVKENNFNYIDAICYYCETNNIEVESVSKLISKPLKERLKWDATRLNFMKPTSRAKLPL